MHGRPIAFWGSLGRNLSPPGRSNSSALNTTNSYALRARAGLEGPSAGHRAKGDQGGWCMPQGKQPKEIPPRLSSVEKTKATWGWQAMKALVGWHMLQRQLEALRRKGGSRSLLSGGPGAGAFCLVDLRLSPPVPSPRARCCPDEIAGSAGRRRLRVGHNK